MILSVKAPVFTDIYDCETSMPHKRMRELIVLSLCCYSYASWGAGFGINATRIIYHEQAPAAQVSLRNTLVDTAYLVQATVVDNSGLPVKDFAVLPPLFRLNPGSDSSVRIVYQPLTGLREDRESVFYFKTVAIPNTNPLTRDGRMMTGQLKMAVGNRIKLFYRPKGIVDPSKDTFRKLTFSRVPAGIKVNNPTPYNVTLSTMSVDGSAVSIVRTKSMISPFSSEVYLSSTPGKKTVKWGVINDLGGVDEYSGVVQ
ncbi:fimbrial biogenesis chaperone [Serratia marcescens]|uniref:fimbrial biogenesis chaperone n=1 Tax=Serratia marcescens TaxID=615 RepID=UPI0021BD2E5B|nr:molecular chaperone [Serratia marcescens]